MTLMDIKPMASHSPRELVARSGDGDDVTENEQRQDQ